MTASSTYDPDREVDELYALITGRRPFRYDPGTDPLYRAAADRYTQNGRLAMRDTMGQAAALTGGYGSSYAQSLGQQQYDEYLRALSEAMPEYYRLAYQQYSAQGDALRDAYDLAWQRRSDAYGRERDALSDERYEQKQAAAAEQTAYTRRQTSYSNLSKLISSTGYSPSSAELKAAGMSKAQAEALRKAYLRDKGLLPAGSGGGGGGYKSTPTVDNKKQSKAVAAGVTGTTTRTANTLSRSGSGFKNSDVTGVKGR